MASAHQDALRDGRLHNLFRDIVSGKRVVQTPKDAELFLESVRIQISPSSCLESIIAGKQGLEAVKVSVRMNLNVQFMTSHVRPFLQYMSNPAIKTLGNGQLLHKLILAVADPPTFWHALIARVKSNEIGDAEMIPFSWLALEVLLLPSDTGVDLSRDVQDLSDTGALLKSKNHAVRDFGYRIQNILQLRSSPSTSVGADGPGGRHDNDHANFRDINIYPTTDEFLSIQPPFYRTASEVAATDLPNRPAVHLDNQFRQLREDMLAELREDIQVAIGTKKAKRTPLSLGHLELVGVGVGEPPRLKKFSLQLNCHSGLRFPDNVGSEKDSRKKFLKENPTQLKHQSFGVLIREKAILGFAFVERDIDLLAQSPPVISLQFTDGQGLRSALLAFKLPGAKLVKFVLVGTSVFAYEPVLNGLKEITDLPLHDILVDPESSGTKINDSKPELSELAAELTRALKDLDTEGAVDLPRSDPKVRVDASQLESMILALTRPIALIQGPPGTGKSFIGARVAKSLHGAGQRILVLSYTNHALNQFLEDLMDVDIPTQSMVRVGGSKTKCTDRTSMLHLSDQRGGYRLTRDSYSIIDQFRTNAQAVSSELKTAFDCYNGAVFGWKDVAEYLEFCDETFHRALLVPTEAGNWSRAGVQTDYLYKRWAKGHDAGVFKQKIPADMQFPWNLSRQERESHIGRWQSAMVEELAASVERLATSFNKIQQEIDIQFSESDRNTLSQKTIIGCTTTGAAKYSRLIRAARPDIVLVEEAGEILESHVLTALAPTVKQIILIGDHKQLRPKINNYALSVEKGDGFDLNRSLFERLIMQGAAHTTLRKQHRMAREISCFPRALTYPELLDGPNTGERPRILGLRNRVIFLNHGKQEENDKSLKDDRDPTSKDSKRNVFEAEMVLRCVKYLGQQGYSNDKIAVLAPYLGQVRVLQDLLQKNQNVPQLSDMDKMELLRAGLISEAAAKMDRKPLRLSTIDNYQGEESDIVIASLTRCNGSGDIGFMFAPERLNVLITRARNCLVIIGNMETFMSSKKGRSTWHPFFDLLKSHSQLYDGLPVQCERHPDKTALLKEPIDFEKVCPEGGCIEPCNSMLRCGIHRCTLRCHRVTDHSKTACKHPVEKVCARQHKSQVRCERKGDACPKCIKEDQEEERRVKKALQLEEDRLKEQERRIRRDLQLEEDRLKRQEAYQRQLQEAQDKAELQQRILKYKAEEEDQKKVLKEHENQLASLKGLQDTLDERKRRQAETEAAAAKAKARAAQNQQANQSNSTSARAAPDTAREEWVHLKKHEGARSRPVDDLMGMIGLEDVKQAFLSIKSKVDTTMRQGISFAKDRYGCSMLGNPGTGKTTVARLYAKFLTEVGVIPGDVFKETTGAALANLAVSGCEKIINEILNGGGGVLFIDEAYQLTSGNSPGGGAVLDYLLAEVENFTGKVVFVLAGYNKQMESFFAHNPGIPSRFPFEMKFADYTDDELLDILVLKINNKYSSAMSCEDGLRGLYCRIVTRRIGRGRGTEGFGNARTVENDLERITRRQADRLRKERKAGRKTTDDWMFTKEDLIGPEPAQALSKCQAWIKLQALVGLAAVKEAVRSLVDSIQHNYKRELAEQPPIEYSLNKVFLGSPGTGKTTVAKLYGEILADIGLLSKGEVVVKNPSDFIGAHIGQSEQHTKGILAATIGKVLVIDEAYALYGDGSSNATGSNSFKTAIVDTIVAEVQSVPGDDRCVLLLGYKDQMEDMFQNVNPGLSRRFPIASAFNFEDFSDDELRTIFNKKLKEQGYAVTDQTAKVAMEILGRARNRPNFGNAGEIDIMLDSTKARHMRRLSKGQAKSDTILEAQDFDEEFDRAERSETNLKKLFEGTVGCEQTVALLEGYQDTVRTLKSLDMDPKESIPFNFLFRGPPGTGKTTTARKMGKVFYDMGYLAAAEVIECSTTELIGQYVGHTGPKVQQVLDKALGRVLFIDEAYRLGEGHFAKEAMDEIVDSVTKAKYYKKLIIILAGYEADINRLMSVNPGLTSRFPEVIDFRALTPKECISLLLELLQKQKGILQSKGKDLDLSCLESPVDTFEDDLIHWFTQLGKQESWASARDVQTVAKSLFNKLLRRKDDLAKGCFVLHQHMVVGELDFMLKERESRSKSATAVPSKASRRNEPPPAAPPQTSEPPSQAPNTASTSADASPSQGQGSGKSEDPPKTVEPPQVEQVEHIDTTRDDDLDKRDAGVSDEVWDQLQRDREEEEKKEEEYKRLQEECEKAKEAERAAIVKRLLGEREESRKAAEAAETARVAMVKRLLEEQKRRAAEEEKKRKLMVMGLCPMGWQWVRQAGGYRCRGGSHWIGDDQVDRL